MRRAIDEGFRRVVAAVAVTLGLSLAACGSTEGGELSIRQLEPAVGPMTGDQPVKILGSGFRADIGYTVYFGPRKAPQVVIADSETMIAVTPAGGKPGKVDLVIIADDGPAWKVHEAYTYQEPTGNIVEQLGEGQKKGKLVY